MIRWLKKINQFLGKSKNQEKNDLPGEQDSFSKETRSNRFHKKDNPVYSFVKETRKEQDVKHIVQDDSRKAKPREKNKK
ncbi:MAG: hypothetical protein ACOCWG_04620 [bacterium]